MDVYSLKTGKSESTDEIPDGYTVLRENFKTPQRQPLSVEERITKLEIGSLYKGCTEKIIHIYEEEQKIPKLINAVQDLVETISSSQQQVSSTKETYNTEEASKKLDCSPQFLRELARSGKIPHRRDSKNFKFRQADIDAYQASETRSGADMRKNSRKRLSVQNVRRTVEAERKEEKKSESEEVFPLREEFKKLWRS